MTESDYQRIGWEVFREILVLKDSGDALGQKLSALPECNSLLNNPPPFPSLERDRRFLNLAEKILQHQHLKLPTKHSQIFRYAVDTMELWRKSELESSVRSFQTDQQCSLAMALSYLLHKQETEVLVLGTSFLLESLLRHRPSNASLILSLSNVDLKQLKKGLTLYHDSQEAPSASEFFARARELASILEHPVWGTDHLLLVLLSTECAASQLLQGFQLQRDHVLENLQNFQREAQKLLWRADEESSQEHWMVRDLSEGLLRTARLPRSPEAQYEEAGEEFAKGLLSLSPLLEEPEAQLSSSLRKAISEVKAQELLPPQALDPGSYYHLARRYLESSAKSGWEFRKFEELALKVIKAWKSHPARQGVFSKTLARCLSGNFETYPVLKEFLSLSESEACQALLAQKLNVALLRKALDSIETKPSVPSSLQRLTDRAEDIASELSQTPITTLHLLIAILEDQNKLEVTRLFRKLQICPERLREHSAHTVAES